MVGQNDKPGAEFFDVLLQANAFEAIAGKTYPSAVRRFGYRLHDDSNP